MHKLKFDSFVKCVFSIKINVLRLTFDFFVVGFIIIQRFHILCVCLVCRWFHDFLNLLTISSCVEMFVFFIVLVR